MNWKEFFKPTKIKVIFIVTIGLLTIFSRFSISLIQGGDVYSALDNLPLIIFTTPAFLYARYANTDFGPRLVSNPIIYFIITLIYWYFLSCLLVWIYNKVKKK